MSDDRIVAIIPARGGSKGIPRKNLIDFCGRPLLAWTIIQALRSTRVDEVFVSSDDPEILRLGESLGAKSIVRPAEFASDTAPSEDALVHALQTISETSPTPSLVVFLQATSPLRRPGDIDGAIAKLEAEGADSLISGSLLEDFFLWAPDPERPGSHRSLNFDHLNRPRRQDVPPQYLENGSMYLFRPGLLLDHGNRLGGKIAVYEMPFWTSYEVDSMETKEVAEWYFHRRLVSHFETWPTLDDLDLIVYDFDGVLTDNRVLTLQDGTEGVIANRSDGLAINRLKAAGVKQLILSTETNHVVAARARKVGVDLIQGSNDKALALQEHCKHQGYRLERVLYVGNDLNDLSCMQQVGWSAAPLDANAAVRRVARLPLQRPGGAGVVVEIASRLLGRDG